MRGKAPMPIATKPSGRITPAYAGKRQRKHVRHPKTGDHPRLCGEKVAASQKQACESGSPPPMRGKARRMSKDVGRWRITPAYAGKRPPFLS